MINIIEILILVILGVWFLLTLIYQCFTATLMRYTWRWDIFRLLPSYQLFSKVPRNFQLSYRHRLVDGTVTTWHDIPLYSPHAWSQALWHPDFLSPHILSSLVENMVSYVESRPDRTDQQKIQRLLDYRGIIHCLQHLQHLQHLQQIPTASVATAYQFKIVEAHGHTDQPSVRLCFCSEFYTI